jgi:hypothetical protein
VPDLLRRTGGLDRGRTLPVVQEQMFESRGGRRINYWLLAVPCVVPLIQLARATAGQGVLVAVVWTGPVAVLSAVLFLMARRGWTRVGADGITICRGLGSGRTVPWREVSRVEIRHGSLNAAGSARSIRIHLANGKRRYLPGLTTTGLVQDPQFDAKAAAVMAWWEQGTRRSVH